MQQFTEELKIKKTNLAKLGLIFTTLAWGATFVITKEALNDAPPFTFNAYRFLIAFFSTFLIVRNEIIHLTKIEFKGALICSIFLFSGYNFQNFGLWLDSTPTTSAFITSVSVILVPIFLVFTGKQKISYKTWYSVILALIGLFMLLNPISTGFKIGDVITFGCAIFFAGHIIYQDESVKKEINIFRFFLVQIGIVCILSFLCSLIFEPKSLLNSMNSDFWSTILIQALLINGILATTIAIMIMVWAQKIVSASQTAIFFSLEPLFAALFSWYLIGEKISLFGCIGGLVIIIAIIISDN